MTMAACRVVPSMATKRVGKAAAAGSMWYGPDRKLWLGDFSPEPPAWLKGEYPGDYGLDPCGFSCNPETFARYRELELMHARWAMLGLAGIVSSETLVGVPWFKAGNLILQEGGLDFLNNPNLIHAQNIIFTLAVQVIVMAQAEAFRVGGGPIPPFEGAMYPGGNFDPLGLGEDPEALAELKVKEIKNGRLAMFACLGCYVQASLTGKGPIENWQDHIANPGLANGFALAGKFAPGNL